MNRQIIMSLLRQAPRSVLVSLAAVALQSPALSQAEPPPQITVAYNIDTGWVRNDGTQREVIISFNVFHPQADWLRLYFDEVALGGDLPSGNQALLRVTSLHDGAIQELNPTHVRQWQKSTCYFNGDSVQVEVLAYPGTGARLVLRALDVGLAPVDDPSQCGPADNRVLSSDPRSARLLPIGCTGWLINDCNHCLLTAGHCQGSISTVEFNVPLSSGGGSLNHPGPEDQYAKDNSSLQGNGGNGVGDDWAYFGTFPNSTTGLTAFEAQGQSFILMNPPGASGTKIRITGYGTDSGNHNQVQQTEVGPMVVSSGTTVGYRTDTTGGNSGSPVIWKQRDFAVGIHTHGGCSSSGGNNWGTGVNHSSLGNALNNPQGVCAGGPPCQTIFADGFESGDFATGGWTTQNSKAKVTFRATNSGSFGARLKKDTWAQRAISTLGFANIELNVDHRTKNYEAGDEFVVEYWNGSAWVEVIATAEGQWRNRNYAFGSDADNNPNLMIRFRTTALENKERTDIDNVELVGR